MARRQRGTNMPDPDPLVVRRREPTPAPAQHSPTDVYGFLTSFTSGVQRGLDEAHHPDPDER